MSPLFFLLLLPLIAVLAIMLGAPARWAALVATGSYLLATLFLFTHYDRLVGGWQFLQETTLIPTLGLKFSLGADGLSLTMLLLTALVALAAVWVTPRIERFPGLFYSCLLFIVAGLTGAFSSLDTFFLYGFHEIALIPVFIMIGLWGSGDRQAAAWKATLYLGTGSFIVLLGIIALYLAAPANLRSFDLRVMRELSQTGVTHPAAWMYLLLLIGFGTLVSLFPFHSWAPSTYANAPAPTAMLHAGVLKKFGLYGLIRLALPIFPHAIAQFSTLLLLLLVSNILYIGYVTLAQRRLDWTIAYSSVMHMGTIFLGLVSMNRISLSGATLLMFGHGLSVAALFALCGALRRRTETLEYQELGGLAQLFPMAALLFGFATMAAIGLPGFANFAGEILIFFGATASAMMHHASVSYMGATIAAIWGLVLSAVYMLRAYRAVFFGPLTKKWHEMNGVLAEPAAGDAEQGVDGATQLCASAVGLSKNSNDLSPSEWLPIVLLIIALLITGIIPQWILNMVTTAFC